LQTELADTRSAIILHLPDFKAISGEISGGTRKAVLKRLTEIRNYTWHYYDGNWRGNKVNYSSDKNASRGGRGFSQLRRAERAYWKNLSPIVILKKEIENIILHKYDSRQG